jgi:hypothetical protein
MIRIRPAPRWLRDDRGAVAVVGLVMAVLLVGLLWYVVGVGNAVAARERAQEAADAAAFSVAVGQARGMNTLVLINLILSVLAGIRLVVNVVFVVLGILTAIFGALSWLPPFAALFAVTSSALGVVKGVRDGVNTATGQAMNALGVVAEEVTAHGAAVAMYTPDFISRGYKPIVKEKGGYIEPIDELPVEVDTTGEKLCGKAAEAFEEMTGLIFASIGVEGVGKILGRIMGLARPLFENPASAVVFCGLGGNPPEVQLPSDVAAEVEKGCEEGGDETDKFKCNTIANPEDKRICVEKCIQAVTLDVEGQFNGAVSEGSEAIQSGLGIVPPANRRVRQNDIVNNEGKWVNGGFMGQYLAVLPLNLEEATKIGPAGVLVGGFGRGNLSAVPSDAGVAFAQAELYYDCDAGWDEDACNGGDEAMWNFRWRGRLRMVNPGSEAMQAISAKLDSVARARWTGPGGAALQSIPTLAVH